MRNPLLVFLLCIAGAAQLWAGDLTRLDMIEPAGEVQIKPDQILAQGGEAELSPAELGVELRHFPLVVVGEQHTGMAHHRVQLRVIEELVAAGAEVIVGLEMYPYTRQEVLDRWSRGDLSEAEFLEAGDWYGTWGFPWPYYRDIFLFAKEHQLPMVGLNAPGKHLKTIRKEGKQGLPEDHRQEFPDQVNTSSEAHYKFFRAHFDDDAPLHSGMQEEQWGAMFTAQCWWDAVMAHQAREALKENPRATLVVIAGSGHTAYGLGISRQFTAQGGGRGATVMPVEVSLEKGSVGVAKAYGDYLWGIEDEIYPVFPDLGFLSRAKDEGRTVLHVEEGSAAGRAGLKTGDVILRVNGKVMDEAFSWSRWQAGLRWSDHVLLDVRRGEERLDLTLKLQRFSSGAASQSQPAQQTQPSGQTQPGSQTQSGSQTQPR